MRRLPRRRAGLGSRIALRTFLLFCLCSVAPVLLFAGLGYGYVRSELRDLAQSNLDAASKQYGVLVYERLGETRAFLEEIARLHLLERALSEPDAYRGERVRVVSIQEESGSTFAAPAMQILRDVDGPLVRMQVSASLNGRTVTIVGEPFPDYLWNADATDGANAQFCVYTRTVRLHCTSGSALADAAQPALHSDWHLFLRANYRTEDWLIRAEQHADAVSPGLRAFGTTLLITAGLAIFIALLVSSVQIRRSHRPLAVLTSAARRMSRGRFDAPLRLTGADEYSRLAEAFNGMAGSIRRQLRLLAAFARIDRIMLARPAVEPVIESLLPRIRRLLHCETAAVVLREPGSSLTRVWAVRGAAPERLELTRANVTDRELLGLLHRPRNWLPAVKISGSELHFLREDGITLWNTAAIRVGSEVRGALILGFCRRPARSARIGRHVASLAHRLAVALGNEDRERALIHQAYYDSLTGLPNRQLFKDRLEQELARTRAGAHPVALFFVDLDRFKNVNDSLGHGAGDELLKTVAHRLVAVVGSSHTLARLGGDEFTVMAPGLSAPAASALAAAMLDSLKTPIAIGQMECVVQASIGIAMAPADGATAETLVRNADTAMYRAKSLGRGTAVFFEDRMNAQAVRRLRLEQRLRLALENDQLQQCYQLKVHADDGSPAGYEALARWQDAELGVISPAEFIAVAEETGLIGQLDRWSIRTACRTARRWQDLGIDAGHIAVNVSLRHVRNHSLVDFVAQCLAEHRLTAGTLELEITESTLAEHPEEVARVLDRIRAFGVRVAIDDFGTGYSSMAVLQKMPIDILKIDRSFVIHAAEDADAAALLEALITVARGLRKAVVAEGVETQEQVALLSSLGCQYLQGFLFAHPATAAQIEERAARSQDARLSA